MKTDKLGTLYICDRNGINAEPLNADDAPYTYEDAATCELGDPMVTLREATVDDDCAAEVDFVAVNVETGAIAGYYIFRPAA